MSTTDVSSFSGKRILNGIGRFKFDDLRQLLLRRNYLNNTSNERLQLFGQSQARLVFGELGCAPVAAILMKTDSKNYFLFHQQPHCEI